MTSRAFGMVFACVVGTPLLSAALIILCGNTTAAVIACLALAAGGIIGAGAAIVLLAPGARQPREEVEVEGLKLKSDLRERATFTASIDQETSDAIRVAVEQLTNRRNAT
jgi:hypothetical protein